MRKNTLTSALWWMALALLTPITSLAGTWVPTNEAESINPGDTITHITGTMHGDGIIGKSPCSIDISLDRYQITNFVDDPPGLLYGFSYFSYESPVGLLGAPPGYQDGYNVLYNSISTTASLYRDYMWSPDLSIPNDPPPIVGVPFEVGSRTIVGFGSGSVLPITGSADNGMGDPGEYISEYSPGLGQAFYPPTGSFGFGYVSFGIHKSLNDGSSGHIHIVGNFNGQLTLSGASNNYAVGDASLGFGSRWIPAPQPPSNLTSLVVSKSLVHLAWNTEPHSEAVTISYSIYRSIDGKSYAKIASDIPPSNTSFDDVTAPTGNFYYIRAVDKYGQESNASNIVSIPLQITTPSILDATSGSVYSQQLDAIGGDGNYVWVVKGAPDGLVADSSESFIISGVPNRAGSYSIPVQVLDTSNHSASKTYSMSVNAPPLQINTQNLSYGEVGASYNFLLQASGGGGKYIWSMQDDSIPEGLNLLESGAIIGTPTWHFTPSTNINVQVQDNSGQTTTATLPFNFNIPAEEADGAPEISSLDACIDNEQYFTSGWPTSPALPSDFYPLPSDDGIGSTSNGISQPQVSETPHDDLGAMHEVECHTKVPYDVAFQILDNLRYGETSGFKPLGVGQCSWFTAEGTPYVGGSKNPRLLLPARVKVPENRLIFVSGDNINAVLQKVPVDLRQKAINLDQMFLDMANNQNYINLAKLNYFNGDWKKSKHYDPTGTISSDEFLSVFLSKIYTNVANKTIRLNGNPIEKLMWERVGHLVRSSAQSGGSPVAEVFLGAANSKTQFSKREGPGTFLVVCNEAYMRIPGRVRGMWTVIAALKKEHLLREADLTYQNAVYRWISKELSGDTQAAVKRVAIYRFSPKGMLTLRCVKTGFIIVQLAQGAFEIYTAHDKRRAIISVVSGTAGAAVVGGAVATFGTPLLALGPLGWLGYGALDLAGGGVGYFIGSHAATYIYDMNVTHAPPGLATFLKTD